MTSLVTTLECLNKIGLLYIPMLNRRNQTGFLHIPTLERWNEIMRVMADDD